MIRWLNRHRWVMPAVETAVLFFLMFGPFWDDPLSPPSIVCVLFVAVSTTVAQSSLLSSEERQAMDAFDQCNPQPLLQFCQEMQGLYPPAKRANRRLWTNLKLNELAALCDLGQLTRAHAVLREVDEGEHDPLAQAYIQLNRAALLLQGHRAEEARIPLETAQNLMSGMRLPRKAAARWKEALDSAQWDYTFQTKGGSQSLLEEAMAGIEAAKTLRARVCMELSAGECLLALGQLRQARPHLQFALENSGGMTAGRQEAQRLLTAQTE